MATESTAESYIQKAKDLASNATDTISDQLNNFGLSAKSLMDSDIASVVKSLPSTAGNFLSSAFKQNESLTDLSSKVSELTEKNNKEFSTLSKSIAKQINDASKNVTFVTSATKQSIGNVELPFGSTGLNLEKASSNTLKKIQELANTDGKNALETAKSAKSAIADVLASTKSKGASLLNDVKDSAKDIYSPLANINNSVSQVIDPNNWKKIVKENTEFLPSPLQSFITKQASTQLNKLSQKTKKISSITGSIDNITSKVANINNFDSVYNLITDPTGNKKYGHGDGLGLDIIASLYNDASQICPSTRLSELYDYGTYKDLYDILVKESIDNKMADLLGQMLDCNSSAKLKDKRTESLLQDGIVAAAKNGDPFTVDTILNDHGLSLDSVANAKNVALSLTTNLKDSSDTNVQATYNTVMTKLGFNNTKEVVSDNAYKDAISCEKLTLVSNNPGIVKSVVNDDDTVQSAAVVYSKYKEQAIKDTLELEALIGTDIDSALAKYNKPQW